MRDHIHLQIKGRTSAQGAERRAAIMAAAERQFAKAGLAGSRTDEIAAEAGVNKALLYYYFKSKEHLYEAVIEDHFHEFNRQAIEVANTSLRAAKRSASCWSAGCAPVNFGALTGSIQRCRSWR